jgi:hypothetical protein
MMGFERSGIFMRWRRTAIIAFFITSLAGCPWFEDDDDDPPPPPPPAPYQPGPGRALGISPIAQQTQVWCWAAAAEMVFRYYGLPNLNPALNYQCGIVAAYYGPSSSCWFNCFSCIAGIPTALHLRAVIEGYGVFASQFFQSRVLSSAVAFSALSFVDTAREIDSGRPIVAGISPSGYFYPPGISEHAVVIVGYRNDSSGQRIVVNDPFPYGIFTQPDPYTPAGATAIAPGQYSVPYSALVGHLRWANTIYQIQ